MGHRPRKWDDGSEEATVFATAHCRLLPFHIIQKLHQVIDVRHGIAEVVAFEVVQAPQVLKELLHG